jgi:cysteine sulfinate desulfinase/cysteine desulfurase-like protein
MAGWNTPARNAAIARGPCDQKTRRALQCSSGSACSSGTASRVLAAMGVPGNLSSWAIRLSPGRTVNARAAPG